MTDTKEEVKLPENYRECTFVGKSSSITLRSTYSDENLELLIVRAMGTVFQYEDERLHGLWRARMLKEFEVEDKREQEVK